MVTSYYLMNLKKNKTMEIGSYYTELYNSISMKDIITGKTLAKCRVCLKESTKQILKIGNPNLIDALKTFTQIDVNGEDDLPKGLCDQCYEFINAALLFRETAKRTDNILKQVKLDTVIDKSDIFPHDTEYDFNIRDDFDVQKQETNEFKTPKKKRVYHSPKVTCEVCSKVINRSYYKEHLTMHDPNHKKYVCDVCGKSFRLRCAYYNHSLRHRNDFPFKCQFCPYRGRYAELLKMHLRTHSGEYRYMCSECPARFLYKSNLNTHALVHKEPQLKCDLCNRAFYTKLLLRKHYEADHLGIKNHVCNLCGKAFGYRNAMMKHQRCVHKREKLSFGRMPSYLLAESKNKEAVQNTQS